MAPCFERSAYLLPAERILSGSPVDLLEEAHRGQPALVGRPSRAGPLVNEPDSTGIHRPLLQGLRQNGRSVRRCHPVLNRRCPEPPVHASDRTQWSWSQGFLAFWVLAVIGEVTVPWAASDLLRSGRPGVISKRMHRPERAKPCAIVNRLHIAVHSSCTPKRTRRSTSSHRRPCRR